VMVVQGKVPGIAQPRREVPAGRPDEAFHQFMPVVGFDCEAEVGDRAARPADQNLLAETNKSER
jgi:hypothetical protein